MINLKIEVTGASEQARELRKLALRCYDLGPLFLRAGFFMVVKTWDRITHAAATVGPETYSKAYIQWLIRNSDWSGKLVGIVTGALIAQTRPEVEGQTYGEIETMLGRDYVEIGFINPSPKAHGFLGWFRRKFGKEAIRIEAEDQEQIVEIFDKWLSSVA